MKLKLIAALAVGVALLSGCAGELRDEAAQATNEEVLNYVAEYQPACKNSDMLYTPNLQEMHYRESLGKMNKLDDIVAVQDAAKNCTDIKIAKAKVEAEETASGNNFGDQLNALGDCAMAPIACRVHVVNSDLNKAGW